MVVLKLIKDIKDFNRFREILTILVQGGFGYLLIRSKLSRFLPIHTRFTNWVKKIEQSPLPIKLRELFINLGPTFIKFGQILSLRPDILPSEYIKELEKLQDQVPAIPFKDIKSTLEKQLKIPLNKVFKSFSPKPIASASLAQVHKATLISGEIVAVKVKRPNIEKTIDLDIDIMYHFAHLLEHHYSELRKLNLIKIVEEFARYTHAELDFTMEARNAIRIKHELKNLRSVKIPEIYPNLTTRDVLVLEFIDGVELNKYNPKVHKNIKIGQIMKIGLNSSLTQVFKNGFFHADPHPGNLIIYKKNKLAIVDFGIMGHFDQKLKNKCINLFMGILSKNSDKVIKALIAMGMKKNTDIELKSKLETLLAQLEGSTISEIKLSQVLEQIYNITIDHNVHFPKDFVLFGKTIATLEGLALKYDPKFQIVKECKPFIKMNSRKIIAKNVIKSIKSFADSLSSIPTYTLEIMDKIKDGKIKVDIDDMDIKRLNLEIEKSSGNLSVGMIIAALIIAAAITYNIQIETGSLIYGYPILSIIATLVALVLGIWLIKRTVFAKLWR